MRKWVVFVGFFFAAAVAAHAQPIKMLGEEYPQFSYREAGTYKGAAIDQVAIMMEHAGLPYSIETMPWARALMLAETQEMTCIFMTAHNQQRDKRFKWVEPLMIDRTILARRTGSGINPATLNDATKFIVGTQTDDVTADILKAKNFDKVDLASDFKLTLIKLLRGRIDLMPITENYFKKLKREGVAIENVLVLSEQVYAVACNKSVPDADISRMQVGLKTLIDDGTQQTLFRKYGLDR